VILSVSPGERRISLGLKQALGDPWIGIERKYPVGSAVEGPVTRLAKFGAFVQLTEGVEGLVHVSEIVADRHIHHPQDVLKVGQTVRALVLAIDVEKRQIKLSMKQLVPTSLDEYLAEHGEGDSVSGRVVEESAGRVMVELGEGIRANCAMGVGPDAVTEQKKGAAGLDLSSLSSMLEARWKGSGAAAAAQPDAVRVGQVRSFRIVKLDREAKVIELTLA
jgi:small subunit ribosomal protein S1